MNSTPACNWQPGDLDAIRIALGISAARPAVEAINQAMLQLEQATVLNYTLRQIAATVLQRHLS